MSLRALLLILVALAVTAGTVYFANSWLNRERAEMAAMREEPEQAKPEVMVLVAKDSLASGAFVRKEDLRWQAWPDKALPETYLVQGKQDPAAIVGGVVRHGIEAGEPITTGQVVAPGDRGFMAAVLNPGMRAVSVPVNAATAVSGFVFPGDLVDLVLTMNYVKTTVSEEGEKRDERFGSETFLSGVRVLAVDQDAKDRGNEPTVGKTVTVEVTPAQVEVLAVAMELGRISLSLHSLARPDQPMAERLAEDEQIQLATTDTTVSDAEGGAEAAPPADAGQSYDVPAQGDTYTMDTEASRLLKARLMVKKDGGSKVVQLRGGTK